MIPHPDTAWTIIALEHQERLRNAANARLVASAQASAGSTPSLSRSARRFVAAWCGGWRLRIPWAIKRVSSPMTSS
jgi:hypothetical protein